MFVDMLALELMYSESTKNSSLNSRAVLIKSDVCLMHKLALQASQ